ncbi:uncharacterized protein Z518_09143 [Rhinocladiella mackenziei CBS 650.93]|uniref:Glycosyl transferase CAP10 domain-containing protein n=1 Tax=Rhinocladiella mackenziei CBS 650.93 TaxID=1442369 RepID=A0A0D2FHD2_9EURO|nr:uncharacterized protein Z518_09143 [Rhinocladiella mackenziei CBS 650.93]KIX01417.1 hypothetical protein Z518_09143 [Rhinocladiella mackenziei CBS 650.93]
MAKFDTLCSWISMVTAACLAHLFPISTAHDRPVHLVVLALLACSFALPSASRVLPRLFQTPDTKQGLYTALPLEDLGQATGGVEHASPSSTQPHQNGKVRISILAVAVCALSLRIELYRRISNATECTIDSVEVFLPFMLAFYDAVRSQRALALKNEERPDSSVYDSLRVAVASYILRPRTRFLLSTFLVCYGCYLTQGLWSSSNSTYICPLVVGESKTIPAMQVLALFLDLGLALIIYETSPKSDGRGLSGRRCVILWSSVMIATSVVWSMVGLIVYIFRPEDRAWLLFFQPSLEVGTLFAIAGHVVLFCFLCISTLHWTMIGGTLDMSTYLTALVTMIPGFEFIWSHKNPFPPAPTSATTVSFLLIIVGVWTYRRIQQALGTKGPMRLSRSAMLFTLLCILISPTWLKKDYVHFHPIDMLIYDAKVHHDNYLDTIGSVSSLEETVARYQQRYNRNPPPGFDIWFEYAKNRSALIVDEFDQIYEDLLPFRTIPPAVLRKQTWEMVSNPWNEISGITIRDGNAAVQENVLPTHRWMLEGVAVLINSFARYLPDMDLAFNLNDESRVAVPYDSIEFLREQGRVQDKSGSASWSGGRAAGWLPIPEQPITETIFRDMSFRNTFRKYGSVGCEPSSLARRFPHISSQSHICGSCVAPHSLGQFVSSWSEAADICHQPDVAYLHGFYLSPAAFKTSYQLMPVFSQSKPHGYNDILYPSAWNYMDKVIYAPTKERGTPGQDDYHPGFPDLPFEQKENVLFWRGATSEGVSSGDHAWRGMTRQRLVHMANNLTTAQHDSFAILLPNPADHSKYKYQILPGPAAKELGLNTDIAIVDRIARCGGIGLQDCSDQEAEFSLVGPSDFQAHWRYRFLFDLDGAGFSGRFLPFLQSRSLPFKTALFREWYDSRLTAWLHFVPQDVRLHGVWSTLAYFAGINGTMFGKNIWWEPHLKEGEMIAEAGREWAGEVLRKEDMELYFFRLLLEWARLTDDRRDELGFVLGV